jgi:hypothetical protein
LGTNNQQQQQQNSPSTSDRNASNNNNNNNSFYYSVNSLSGDKQQLTEGLSSPSQKHRQQQQQPKSSASPSAGAFSSLNSINNAFSPKAGPFKPIANKGIMMNSEQQPPEGVMNPFLPPGAFPPGFNPAADPFNQLQQFMMQQQFLAAAAAAAASSPNSKMPPMPFNASTPNSHAFMPPQLGGAESCSSPPPEPVIEDRFPPIPCSQILNKPPELVKPDSNAMFVRVWERMAGANSCARTDLHFRYLPQAKYLRTKDLMQSMSYFLLFYYL